MYKNEKNRFAFDYVKRLDICVRVQREKLRRKEIFGLFALRNPRRNISNNRAPIFSVQSCGGEELF